MFFFVTAQQRRRQAVRHTGRTQVQDRSVPVFFVFATGVGGEGGVGTGKSVTVRFSVAFIPDHDFYPFRNPDPGLGSKGTKSGIPDPNLVICYWLCRYHSCSEFDKLKCVSNVAAMESHNIQVLLDQARAELEVAKHREREQETQQRILHSVIKGRRAL
jgi:hypothetical protein